MRGLYTAGYNATGVNSSPRTLMYITAPSGKVVELIEAHVTIHSTTDGQIEVAIQRITTLGTPTATAVTPTPHELGDQAAGSTVAANVTMDEPVYTAGKFFNLQSQPSRSGWHWYSTQVRGNQIYVAHTASIGLLLNAGITVSTIVDLSVTFREIG